MKSVLGEKCSCSLADWSLHFWVRTVEVCEGLIAQRRSLPAHGRNTEEAGLLGSFIIHLGESCFPSLWTAGQLNCLWINSWASYLPPCSKWSAFKPEKSHYLWQRCGNKALRPSVSAAAMTIMPCLPALSLCGTTRNLVGSDVARWDFLVAVHLRISHDDDCSSGVSSIPTWLLSFPSGWTWQQHAAGSIKLY